MRGERDKNQNVLPEMKESYNEDSMKIISRSIKQIYLEWKKSHEIAKSSHIEAEKKQWKKEIKFSGEIYREQSSREKERNYEYKKKYWRQPKTEKKEIESKSHRNQKEEKYASVLPGWSEEGAIFNCW